MLALVEVAATYPQYTLIAGLGPGEGALTLEGGMGMCRPQKPLFQATF